MLFDLPPDWPVLTGYAEKISGRPNFQPVWEHRTALDAEQVATAIAKGLAAAS